MHLQLVLLVERLDQDVQQRRLLNGRPLIVQGADSADDEISWEHLEQRLRRAAREPLESR